MLVVLGPQLLSQPWLLIALSVYAANLVLAFFVQRPGLARFFGYGRSRPTLSASGGGAGRVGSATSAP